MRAISLCWLALYPCALVDAQEATDLVASYRASAVTKWSHEIERLEQLDASEHQPSNAILFVGSSSIRRWTSIAEDMAPWQTIRRGYGGARFSDLAVFIDRLVKPHEIDALVIFVGNDISGSKLDKSPEEVLKLYKYIVGRVRIFHPRVPIFCIAVTPTSSRFAVWPTVKKMNHLIKDYSAAEEHLHFIDTAEYYLGHDGRPKDELFAADKLHLNRDGYRIWSRIIKAELEAVLAVPSK